MARAATNSVVRVPGPHTRYTLVGDAAAEARVAQDLARLATGTHSEFGDDLRSLVLVGPFARAEGGVIMGAGDEPLAYPGYDALAVFKRRPERHARAARAIAAAWSRLLHTRVRIAVIAQHDLERVPHTRFWYHTGRGQLITLAGDPSLTVTLPRYEATDLVRDAWAFAIMEPLVALALATLEHQSDAALVGHMHRAVLACGDALLLARRAYAPNFEQRVLRLRDAMAPSALIAAYQEAIGREGRPDLWRPEQGTTAAWLATTRRCLAGWHLGAERQRTGTPLDVMQYVAHHAPLFADPEERTRTPVRSILRALPLLSPGLSARLVDPRERLLRVVVALAYRPHDLEARRRAGILLRAADAFSQPDDGTLAATLRRLARSALPEDLGRPFSEWSTGLADPPEA